MIKIWDLPIRLFHWVLVALFAFSWWSGKTGGNAMIWHQYAGYAILSLVLFRVCWGFLGSTTSRFSHFLGGAGAISRYLSTLCKRSPSTRIGHNPVGGWMIVLMLLTLLIQAITGLFANDDIFIEGPLAHWIGKELSDQLTGLHQLNFNVLLILAGLHLLAILFYTVVKKQNLTRAMVTGYQHGTHEPRPAELAFASSWRALGVLLVCVAAVAALVYYA